MSYLYSNFVCGQEIKNRGKINARILLSQEKNTQVRKCTQMAPIFGNQDNLYGNLLLMIRYYKKYIKIIMDIAYRSALME